MAGLLIVAIASAVSAFAFSDPRDGQAYRTVTIGQARWFAQNLNFATADSRCHGELALNCGAYGRLYRWPDAATTCPAGWRLPTDQDWKDLEIALGMSIADAAAERGRGPGLGDRLKPGGDTGYDALYSGYGDPHRDDAFVRLGERAAYWTSTEEGRDDVSALAWHRDVSVDRSVIWRSKVNQTYRLAVRCIENTQEPA
jgi:uncharacterized protein (TIGR02145 family)